MFAIPPPLDCGLFCMAVATKREAVPGTPLAVPKRPPVMGLAEEPGLSPTAEPARENGREGSIIP